MTLKDGYGFGGCSRAPPSKQHLSTPPPPPGPGLLNHSYSVTQGVQSGALVISLMISSVEPDDAGEYKCYDSDQHQHPRFLFQAYNISVVRCLCPTHEGLEDITGDTKVVVNCTLNGYQSSHVGDTSVNITLGHYCYDITPMYYDVTWQRQD